MLPYDNNYLYKSAVLMKSTGRGPIAHYISIDLSTDTLSEETKAELNSFLADFRDGKNPVLYMKTPNDTFFYCPVNFRTNISVDGTGSINFELRESTWFEVVTISITNYQTGSTLYRGGKVYFTRSTELVEIPAPTSADAGKVLGINEDGNYALTDIEAGGAKVIMIDGSNEQEPKISDADAAKLNEFISDYIAGNYDVLVWKWVENNYCYPRTIISLDENHNGEISIYTSVRESQHQMIHFYIANGEITSTSFEVWGDYFDWNSSNAAHVQYPPEDAAGMILMIDEDNWTPVWKYPESLRLGDTTITEAQLQALLAML